jgi:hypothetical protein
VSIVQETTTIEAEFTAAQTDTALVTATATQRIAVTRIAVTLDEATTAVGVGYRVGFGTPSTPTTTGVIASHPGQSPGDMQEYGSGAGLLGVGDYNEDLRITSDVPTGGALRVIVSYFFLEG